MVASNTNSEFAFPIDSEMWRINHQKCGLLFGPAAAILQIAHPRIAQGVAEHSDFESDSLGRLQRTLQSTNRIAFGSKDEALAMKAKLHTVHGQVNGKISDGMQGRKGYSAFEPDLLLWVLATMIEAATRGYESIYSELPAERKEVFYTEMREFGTFFGLAADYGPEDYSQFQDYYVDVLSSDLLGSHPICKELAQKIAQPNDTHQITLIGKAVYFLTVESIPSPVRERLGFKSTKLTRTKMCCLKSVLPVIFPVVPKRLRFYPESIERLKREVKL